MSLFSKLFSGQINWETANSVQKLAALDELPSNDPVLGQLALGEPDAAVRHKAIGLMEAAAQLQLANIVLPGDEDCLAASLGERIGGQQQQVAVTMAFAQRRQLDRNRACRMQRRIGSADAHVDEGYILARCCP